MSGKSFAMPQVVGEEEKEDNEQKIINRNSHC